MSRPVRSLDLAPWMDVPPCPSCGMNTTEKNWADTPAHHDLCCVNCGHSWQGTPAEVRRAQKAQAAWEKEVARERAENAKRRQGVIL